MADVPNYLGAGPIIRPSRRTPDELYYGSDAFRRDPERWLARKRKRRVRIEKRWRNKGCPHWAALHRKRKGLPLE